MKSAWRETGERGSALIITLVLMLMVGAMAGSFFFVQLHRGRLKDDYVDRIEAFYGAEGSLSYAVESVWDGYLKKNSGKAGGLSNFRSYLDTGSKPVLKAGAWTALPLLGMQLGSTAIPAVQVLRTDGSNYTELRFRSSVTVKGHTETVETAYRSQGEVYKGFGFALLSNNISCVFCHANIGSVDKWTGKPYDRVRVASIESLKIRSGASSTVAGSLYIMNKLMDKQGGLLTTLAGTSLDGYQITNGQINPATTKLVDMTPAPTVNGKPAPGYNLYMQYPTAAEKQTDGEVPTIFPPLFGDENANRMVDDSEFAAKATTGGTASGYGYVIPKGSVYGGTTVTTTNPVSLNGTVNGNLVLTGTTANPIKLNGQITVDGDVVIQGVVKGTGSIVARGNVYVTGDLTYNDATVAGKRTYGTAADGTVNTLALGAGGNVLVGDYLTPKGGSLTTVGTLMNGTTANGFGFTMSQLSIFNRNEWQKTQKTLPGDSKGKQVLNSTYIQGYKPKYYVVDSVSPVWVFTKGAYWDDANKTWMGSEHAGSISDLTAVQAGPGAVITKLNPTSSWLTAAQLKNFWINDEKQRVSGAPFRIDALLYTDSSVYTLARGASKSDGQLIVNGSIVAADTGILAGGSLEINYDQRVQGLLTLKDDAQVQFSRVLYVRKPSS